MAKMSGGEALVKSLVAEGVEVLFGIPGIHMSGTVVALRDEPNMRTITTRHEAGATHMADGYARASGKPGVALVVPGTGVYNAASGLATAYARSSPVSADCGPDTAGPDRQGPGDVSRGRRPGGHAVPGDEVAAAGAQTAGSPRRGAGGVPADAHRPSTPRPHRNAARGRGGAGGGATAQACAGLPDSAQLRGPAPSGRVYRRVPAAP